MNLLFSRMVDFVAFNLVNTVGLFDMFFVPMVASKFGFAKFFGAYWMVLIIFGIPAFTSESAYLMPEQAENRSPAAKKWLCCYQLIALMQLSQSAMSQAINKVIIAVSSYYVSLAHDSRANKLLHFYSPNCRLKDSNSSSNGTSMTIVLKSHETPDENELILPSCLTRTRSEVACIVHSLFSDPEKILFYCSIMLVVIIISYALLFGRSLSTYGTIGRLYISLMVLCAITLLLHFFGRNRKALSETAEQRDFDGLLMTSVIYCTHSLTLISFTTSSIGALANTKIKRNYILISIAICFIDTFIAMAFTGLDYLRDAAVQGLCNRDNSEVFIDMESFMSMPDVSSEMISNDQSKFSEYALRGSLKMSESVLMFHHASGSVPWIVFLPLKAFQMMFGILMACFGFILTDIHTSRVLPRSTSFLMCLIVLRFGVVAANILLRMIGQLDYLESYMFVSTQISFLLVKITDCIIIHKNQGFAEHINERRNLLSKDNKLQLFLHDWYIAPSSVVVYHVGYPILLALLLMFYRSIAINLSFSVYFVSFNLLPMSLIATHVYYN